MPETPQFTISTPVMHLVLSQSVWQNLAENKRTYPDWPESPQDICMYLQRYYPIIPILVHTETKGKYTGSKNILFCTKSFSLKAAPSKGGDAYTILSMRPLSLYDHDDLARGAPRVQVGTWFVHTDHSQLNAYRLSNTSNYYQPILYTWEQMIHAQRALSAYYAGLTESGPEGAAQLNPTQKHYLGQVEKVIEATHEVETKKEKQQPILYSKIEPAGKARYNRHDVYRFQRVLGGGDVKKGMFLCLENDEKIRGHITEVEEAYFIVKFERPVDIRTLRNAHALIRSTNDVAYKVQRRALEELRNGTTKNPYLLRILAEGRYQPYQKRAMGQAGKLNTAQQEAYERALSTPDIQLVLGPPGTGKTHTIREITCALGKRHKRVLITAKTHKAVDNVLLHLPQELEVLRVGDSDKVTPKHLLIDERAQTLQRSILQATQEYSQTLRQVGEHLDELDRRLTQLPRYSADLRQAEQVMHVAMTQRDQRRDEIEQTFAQERTRRHTIWQTAEQDFTQQQAQKQKLQQRLTKATQRQNWFLVGFFWRNQLSKLQKKIVQADEELIQKRTQKDAAYVQYNQLPQERSQALRAPAYQQLETRLKEQTQALNQLEGSVYSAACVFANILTKHFAPEQLHPLERSAQQLQSYLHWLQSAWASTFRPTLLARDELMHDWRQELEARTEDLYPILLRMADVIGATCIGSATAKILAEAEYDMVIVDEAGQISVADLLVPLVQGQRALLVGDHQQLPPLADKEVEKQLHLLSREEENEREEQDPEITEPVPGASQLTDFLQKSVFEMLVQDIDNDHYKPLTEQYRMPASIAHFASQHFYGGKLRTGEKRDAAPKKPYRDPLFNKPFVFIDTRPMDPYHRKDQQGQGRETEADGNRSYSNEAEATLIAEIVEVYTRRELEWVVIVPYKGQARLIRERLQKLGEEYNLDLVNCISTVDTFQGGEKDIVIYGFTRSNKKHAIGFLKERRRLNVALTRAKEQLVMVGDSETLTETSDQDFSTLARAMLQHAREYGELLSFRDCRSRMSRGRSL